MCELCKWFPKCPLFVQHRDHTHRLSDSDCAGNRARVPHFSRLPQLVLHIARFLPGITAAPLSGRSLAVMLGDAPPETHAASEATCNIRPQAGCPEPHVIWEPHLTKQEFRDTFAQAPDSPACTTSAGQSGLLSVLSHVVCCVYTEPMGLPDEKQTRRGPC